MLFVCELVSAINVLLMSVIGVCNWCVLLVKLLVHTVDTHCWFQLLMQIVDVCYCSPIVGVGSCHLSLLPVFLFGRTHTVYAIDVDAGRLLFVYVFGVCSWWLCRTAFLIVCSCCVILMPVRDVQFWCMLQVSAFDVIGVCYCWGRSSSKSQC